MHKQAQITKIPRNSAVLYYQIGSFISIIGVIAFITYVSLFVTTQSPELRVFMTGGFIIVALVTLLSIFLLFVLHRSTKYKIIHPSIIEITREPDIVKELLPGRVEIERGLIKKVIRQLPLNEVDRVTMSQPLMGRFFGYGTLVLEQVDKLSQTGDYRLPFVENPENYSRLIQDMIDVNNAEIIQA